MFLFHTLFNPRPFKKISWFIRFKIIFKNKMLKEKYIGLLFPSNLIRKLIIEGQSYGQIFFFEQERKEVLPSKPFNLKDNWRDDSERKSLNVFFREYYEQSGSPISHWNAHFHPGRRHASIKLLFRLSNGT